MAAPAYGNSTNAGTTTAGGQTSLAINVPAGVSNGDLMLCLMSHRNDPGTITFTGWTLVPDAAASQIASATTERMALYYRIASSEPASYTPTWVTNRHCVLEMVYITGQDASSSTAWLDAISGQAETSGGTTNTIAPTLTTNGADRLLVAFFGMNASQSALRAWTPPGTMTERQDKTSGTGQTHTSAETCTETFASAGATGTRTASASGGNSDNHRCAIMVAVKPPGAAAVGRVQVVWVG